MACLKCQCCKLWIKPSCEMGIFDTSISIRRRLSRSSSSSSSVICTLPWNKQWLAAGTHQVHIWVIVIHNTANIWLPLTLCSCFGPQTKSTMWLWEVNQGFDRFLRERNSATEIPLLVAYRKRNTVLLSDAELSSYEKLFIILKHCYCRN